MNALIVVDMQNDFVNGSLAVENAISIIPKVQELIKKHRQANDLIIATKDNHPINHSSFSSNGGQWPNHCVVETRGWEFVNPLNETMFDEIILKGSDPKAESYSGFFDELNRSNGLSEIIKKAQVEKIYVIGLALDFCVKATALDSKKLGYPTYIYEDATKSVLPNEEANNIKFLKSKGIQFINSK